MTLPKKETDLPSNLMAPLERRIVESAARKASSPATETAVQQPAKKEAMGQLYKVLKPGRRSIYVNRPFQYPPPGEWTEKVEKPKAYRAGYHLTEEEYILEWAHRGHVVWEAEYRGPTDGNLKLHRTIAASGVRLTRRVGAIGLKTIQDLNHYFWNSLMEKEPEVKEDEWVRKAIQSKCFMSHLSLPYPSDLVLYRVITSSYRFLNYRAALKADEHLSGCGALLGEELLRLLEKQRREGIDSD